ARAKVDLPAPGNRATRRDARCDRARGHNRPARVGLRLADAAARRRRRARLGGRAGRAPGTRPGALAMRVLGLSGSLRRDSYNRRLLQAAAQFIPEDVAYELWPGIGDLPA